MLDLFHTEELMFIKFSPNLNFFSFSWMCRSYNVFGGLLIYFGSGLYFSTLKIDLFILCKNLTVFYIKKSDFWQFILSFQTCKTRSRLRSQKSSISSRPSMGCSWRSRASAIITPRRPKPFWTKIKWEKTYLWTIWERKVF